jgi:hypothetical protein
MTNRTEIEGSEERAKERGATLFDAMDAEAEYLNSAATVERLLRQFVYEVLDVRKAYNEDRLQGDEAAGRVVALAHEYADIFMGRNAEYAVTAWNSPEQLGVHLQTAITEDSTAEDACQKFFQRLAGDFVDSVVIPAESDIIDDEQGQFRTDVLLEDATYVLLGIPSESPEE